jgi:hypothetical protein
MASIRCQPITLSANGKEGLKRLGARGLFGNGAENKPPKALLSATLIIGQTYVAKQCDAKLMAFPGLNAHRNRVTQYVLWRAPTVELHNLRSSLT